MKCTVCGYEMNDNAKFCTVCGTKAVAVKVENSEKEPVTLKVRKENKSEGKKFAENKRDRENKKAIKDSHIIIIGILIALIFVAGVSFLLNRYATCTIGDALLLFNTIIDVIIGWRIITLLNERKK